MPKKIDYKEAALEFLDYYFRCGFKLKDIVSDYRCGSIPGYSNMLAEIGGLYFTTPENPGKYVAIKQLVGSKTLAKFPIEELMLERKRISAAAHRRSNKRRG